MKPDGLTHWNLLALVVALALAGLCFPSVARAQAPAKRAG